MSSSDFFISSCFVHFRKPDADIFRLALDIAQVPAGQVVYIEDQPMFVQIAEGLGIHGIRHTDYQSTRAATGLVRVVGNCSWHNTSPKRKRGQSGARAGVEYPLACALG